MLNVQRFAADSNSGMETFVTVCHHNVSLAVARSVFDGVFLCCSFSYEMSWMSFGTFLRVFLPTLKL